MLVLRERYKHFVYVHPIEDPEMIKKLLGIALYVPTYYAIGAIKWVVDSPDPREQFSTEAIVAACNATVHSIHEYTYNSYVRSGLNPSQVDALGMHRQQLIAYIKVLHKRKAYAEVQTIIEKLANV